MRDLAAPNWQKPEVISMALFAPALLHLITSNITAIFLTFCTNYCNISVRTEKASPLQTDCFCAGHRLHLSIKGRNCFAGYGRPCSRDSGSCGSSIIRNQPCLAPALPLAGCKCCRAVLHAKCQGWDPCVHKRHIIYCLLLLRCLLPQSCRLCMNVSHGLEQISLLC